ncbi:MAG TPA: MarR family transcriptional regulator [Prolixibacteraceae bacterium]
MAFDKPLGYLLGRTQRVYKNLMVIEFRKHKIELSFEQFVMMQMLNSDCTLIQQDVANQLQKDKSIIVRQINVLLERQYVVRLTNKDDKRKKNLSITKSGMDILNQMKEIAFSVSKKLLSGVTENEMDTFQSVLMKIQENGCTEEEPFK